MEDFKLKYFSTIIIIFVFFTNSWSQQLAFPTAEGYGKYTTGGRGGAVYEVTTLNPNGTGSIGAAISASGPRTVVFKVAGTIRGNFNISNGNITIAGQTAPGDGICIRGNLSTSADNIIIRYIRVRFDPANGANDAIGGRFHKNIIFDHISASWSTDETMTLYHNENTTVQWCIISEACEKFENGVGIGHRFGGIWGNNPGTWHHNLIANNDSRNPRWAAGCGYNDYRNNVLYNWGYGGSYGGEAQQPDDPRFSFSTVNIVANYYKAGPATGPKNRIIDPSTRNGDFDAGQWWVSDNYVDGYPNVTADNWLGVTKTGPAFKLDKPWNAMAIYEEAAEDAYQSVLDGAGCSLPNRDSVDARIIEEVRTGTATYGNNGIITFPSDVGGWPILATGTPFTDSDHDGMSDDWEDNNGLNKNDPSDRNTIGAGGYTNLEIFLNSLVNGGPVTGINVSPAADTIGITATVQLRASIQPYNTYNKNVSWSSSNTSIATVDLSGLVTGIAEGSATITATTEDGGLTATSDIKVIYIPIYKLTTSVVGEGSIGPSSGSYLEGDVVSITATEADGWKFDGWSGDASGTNNPLSLTMDADKSITATFTELPVKDNIVVRAKGTSGEEIINLRVGGSIIKIWTLTTSYQDYIASAVDSGKSVLVEYVNDNGSQSGVQVDYVIRDGVTYQSEDQKINTACGGQYSEKLDCNGYIRYDTPSTTSVEEQSGTIPSVYKLYEAYPNPFNPTTNIQFDIPESSYYSLKVYNSLGQEVASLIDGNKSAGRYNVNFDASNLASGIYIYRLSGNKVNLTRKMLLLK